MKYEFMVTANYDKISDESGAWIHKLISHFPIGIRHILNDILALFLSVPDPG